MVKDDLKRLISLASTSVCWDYWCVPKWPVYVVPGMDPRACMIEQAVL